MLKIKPKKLTYRWTSNNKNVSIKDDYLFQKHDWVTYDSTSQ